MTPGTVWALDDNVNRFGTPPAARALLAAPPADALTAYPAAQADGLRAALAAYAGVAPAEIVTGCGSDDVIDCAIRACAREGGRLVFPAPTFSMLPEFALRQRLRPVAVPFLANGDLDADAMLAARPGVLYLCAPNNPTGHVPGNLDRLIDAAPGLVILDEAYAEYAAAGDPAFRARIADAARAPRLLVTRTLSKAFGLAGLRIGYGVANRALVERIARVRGPYRVGRLAEAAAVAALTTDIGWMEARAREAVAAREALVAALGAAGFAPLPSVANFVLVPVRHACGTARALATRGIRVRAFSALPGTGDAVRITVGPEAAMQAVVAALVAEAA